MMCKFSTYSIYCCIEHNTRAVLSLLAEHPPPGESKFRRRMVDTRPKSAAITVTERKRSRLELQYVHVCQSMKTMQSINLVTTHGKRRCSGLRLSGVCMRPYRCGRSLGSFSALPAGTTISIVWANNRKSTINEWSRTWRGRLLLAILELRSPSRAQMTL